MVLCLSVNHLIPACDCRQMFPITKMMISKFIFQAFNRNLYNFTIINAQKISTLLEFTKFIFLLQLYDKGVGFMLSRAPGGAGPQMSKLH